ncbi:putative glycoprotein [Hubei diptera virus 4]|uniref:Putative glycoprotein n=1 Tax=Hubei diptera virus 4 TaxID=1922885 RepID=A0A1L3KPL1_9VIRU|nr:putative glycoprotein [Hubei diptera virus 4]APG79299.1 putative glycoprotein [Hubei diptera virus 4]
MVLIGRILILILCSLVVIGSANYTVARNHFQEEQASKNTIVFAYNSFTVHTMTMNVHTGGSNVDSFFESSFRKAQESGLISLPNGFRPDVKELEVHDGSSSGSLGSRGASLMARNVESLKPMVSNSTEKPNSSDPHQQQDLIVNEHTGQTKRKLPVVTHIDQEICRACIRQMEADKAKAAQSATSPRGLVSNVEPLPDMRTEFVPSKPRVGGSIEGPNLLSGGIRTSRSLNCKSLLNDVTRLYNGHVKIVIPCFNCTMRIILVPDNSTESLSRKRRSVSEKVSVPLAEFSTRTIGHCPSDLEEVHPKVRSRQCQQWLNKLWDQDKKTWCVQMKSCNKGEYLSAGSCHLAKSGLTQSSLCSDHTFRISTYPVLSSPTVPSFLDEEVCEIEGVKLSKCSAGRQEARRVSIILFNGKETLVTKQHDFIFLENLSSKHNYVCSGCPPTGCKDCTGDAYYRDNFGTSEDGACHCTLQPSPKFGSISLVMGGKTYPIEYYLSQVISVGMIKKVKEAGSPREVDNCPICTASCIGSELSLEGFPDIATTVKICAGSLCSKMQFSDKLSVPPQYLLLQNLIQVQVFSADASAIDSKEVACKVEASCDLIRCHLCMSRLLNPSCYELLDTIVVLLVLSFALGFITLILRLLSIVLTVMKILQLLFRFISLIVRGFYRLGYKLCGYSLKKTRIVYRNLEKLGEDEQIEFIEEQVAEVLVEERKVASRPPSIGELRLMREMRPMIPGRNFNKMGLVIMIIAIFLSVVSCCSQVSHMGLSDAECEVRSGTYECTPTSKVTLHLNGAGTDVCLLIKKENVALGTIQMRISSIKSRCVERRLYWTYDFSTLVQYECFCNSLNKCSSDCEAQKNNVSVKMLEEMEMKRNLGPGRSGCLEVPGHYLNRCVLPMNSCCYFLAQFPPTLPENNYSVRVCSSYVWEVDIILKTFLSDIPTTTNLTLVAGEEKTEGDLGLLMTQVSSPVIPDQDKCIIQNSKGSSYLAECNKETELVLGKVGMIQCELEETIKKSPWKCKHAPGLVSISPGSDSLTYSSIKVNLEEVLKKRKIPLSTPDFTMEKDVKGYYLIKQFSEVFDIQVTIPKVKAVAYSERTSCTLTFKSLRGCFSCLEGAKVVFHSTCLAYPAIGTLMCPDLPASLPMVVNRAGNFSLKLSLPKPIIDSDCNFTLGQTVGSVRLKGTLIEISSVVDGFSVSEGGGGSTGLNFTSLLSSVWSNLVEVLKALWLYFERVLWIAICLASVACVVYITWRVIIWKSAQKPERKEV